MAKSKQKVGKDVQEPSTTSMYWFRKNIHARLSLTSTQEPELMLITGFHMLPDRWLLLIACATAEEREKLPFQAKCHSWALRHRPLVRTATQGAASVGSFQPYLP